MIVSRWFWYWTYFSQNLDLQLVNHMLGSYILCVWKFLNCSHISWPNNAFKNSWIVKSTWNCSAFTSFVILTQIIHIHEICDSNTNYSWLIQGTHSDLQFDHAMCLCIVNCSCLFHAILHEKIHKNSIFLHSYFWLIFFSNY